LPSRSLARSLARLEGFGVTTSRVAATKSRSASASDAGWLLGRRKILIVAEAAGLIPGSDRPTRAGYRSLA